jgi:hypothetical protein
MNKPNNETPSQNQQKDSQVSPSNANEPSELTERPKQKIDEATLVNLLNRGL